MDHSVVMCPIAWPSWHPARPTSSLFVSSSGATLWDGAMSTSPRSGVVQFLAEAKRLAGGSAVRLAAALEPELGYRPSDKAVRSWLRGDRQPDARIILAAMKALAPRGLSFDQIALDQADQRPLQVQVDELRALVVHLHAGVNAHLANHGEPPLQLELPA